MDSFIVTKLDEKKRLDVFLCEKMENYTRSQIKKQIELNNILVNSKFVKAGYEVCEGDKIETNIEVPKQNCEAENLPINIVFENENLIIINKKQGMVVHPASGNKSGTLVNALMFKYKNNLSNVNGEFRPGIVHRLDKNTSGLLVVAKNNFSHNNLAEQIKTKTCKRIYRALVCGELKKQEGKIETNLIRSTKNRKKYEVCSAPKGKKAITHFKVLQNFKNFTYVEFELETGRTHQIRVHTKHIGHPIMGDEEYGRTFAKYPLNGQLLHSYKLMLFEPSTNEKLEFVAPLPDYFQNILENLK